MRFNRYGQISIFVILGLIILLSSVLLINSKYEFKESSIEVETKYKQPLESQVIDYVEFCLERQTEHAFDWTLFGNGKYEKGTYLDEPVHPTLLHSDFWTHVFDQNLFNKKGIIPSMQLYVEDTLPYCLDNFEGFEGIIVTNLSSKFNISISGNGSSITTKLNYPLKIESRENVKYLENFQYKMNHVPLEQLDKDVNTFVGKLNQWFQSFDGRTDGNSPMKWGDPNVALKNVNMDFLKDRTDFIGVVNQSSNSNSIVVIFYYTNPWRPSLFKFYIADSTFTSLAEDPYLNNVVHRYYQDFSKFDNQAVIVENLGENEIYGGEKSEEK